MADHEKVVSMKNLKKTSGNRNIRKPWSNIPRHTPRKAKNSTESLQSRITHDPAVMAGKPCIRGMRISVDQILKALAAGIAVADLLEDYPLLEMEDIRAVASVYRNNKLRIRQSVQ